MRILELIKRIQSDLDAIKALIPRIAIDPLKCKKGDVFMRRDGKIVVCECVDSQGFDAGGWGYDFAGVVVGINRPELDIVEIIK